MEDFEIIGWPDIQYLVEKEDLLLKDLCARLPYGVICEDMEGKVRPLFGITPTQHFVVTLDNVVDGTNNGLKYCTIDCVKPYLRSMSSMTEEECIELGNIKATIENISEVIPNVPYYIEVAYSKQIDWLNKHHFDYRGLIEKGLALEAPEGMYDLK